MKNLGLVFIFSGILLMGLSGLEKVLIFTSSNANDMLTVINLTPEYIWGITNYTFGFGLTSFILGLILFCFGDNIIPKLIEKWKSF